MSVQDFTGNDLPTQAASESEGAFSTPCAKTETRYSTEDSAPQFLKLSKTGVFAVHTVGSEKGLFDFQAKPFPEISRSNGPVLSCDYPSETAECTIGCFAIRVGRNRLFFYSVQKATRMCDLSL